MNFNQLPETVKIICRTAAPMLDRTPEQVHALLADTYAPSELLVGHKQIASYLGISKATLHRRLKSGPLTAFVRKNGDNEWVARREDLEEYRASQEE